MVTVVFLAASAAAFSFGRRPLREKVEAYAAGMGETNIMIMCLVFILAGAFASVAKGAGAVDAAVALAQAVIPARLMVAGVFLVSCLVSLAIGTSCGTIAALAPIALGFSGALGASPALLLGAVAGGAMFGDNLSMISDTTIAATRTQGVRMRDKFVGNAAVAVPAALIVLALYASTGGGDGAIARPEISFRHFLLVSPYVLILALALAGLNVMPLLFIGTLLTAALGCAAGSFDALTALDAAGKGTLGMSETLVVALLAGGFFRLVRDAGGIRWLTDRISGIVRGPRTCELGVFLLVSLVNLFTANNTVAIVVAGPVAKACADRFGADPVRIASVLDTASCIAQGMLPYGAQILIAVGVSRGLGLPVGACDLIGGMYYPPLLALAVLAAVFLRPAKRTREVRA